MSEHASTGWWRWLIGLLLVGGIGAGAYFYFQSNAKSETQYQTAVVSRGALIQTVTATGQLNPVVNVQVGSQISGRIQKLYVDYNSVVKSNQVIAEIDPSTYKVNVQRAEAQVAQSKANLALAEVQAKRAEALFKDNLIPASDHDTAMAQVQLVRAQVLQDEAALGNANVDLSRCTILAPVDGVVISRSVDVGQTVAASFNTPTLFVIANDLSKMQIDALVSEADIGGVELKQPVTFTVDAYPYRTFRGEVWQIRYGAMTNQNVVSYDCVVEVNNESLKLLPGMTANISIITAEKQDALRVPSAAFRFRPPETIAGAIKTNSAAGKGQEGSGRAMAAGGGPGRGAAAEAGAASGISVPGARGGGPRAERGERVQTRTVYLLPAPAGPTGNPGEPQRVEVKIGITDGILTEVLSELPEGAQVITGIISSTASGSRAPAANPFGGGPRRF
jgi:HlyD family secretion protein